MQRFSLLFAPFLPVNSRPPTISIPQWQREIREQQGRFEEQARSVSQWDTILLDNGEKVVQLLDEVTAVSRQQEA